MKNRMQFEREKFKRLMHHVIWTAGERDGFGSTKLNKILWFSDAQSFVLRGRPITGATYIREKYGPVPKAGMPFRELLEREGAIRVWKARGYRDRAITRFAALSAPDTSIFDPEELKIADHWTKHIVEDHTASSISDKSHDYAWEIAAMGEEIPFYAQLVTGLRDPDGAELEWAKRRARELQLP